MPAAGYFSATRHPWPCAVFLLPLLAAYEIGIVWLGGVQTAALRNGADTWFRWGLGALGLDHLYVAPALVLCGLIGWTWVRRADRPDDLFNNLVGMAVESGLFAVGLWAVSRGLAPFLDRLGIHLATRQQAGPVPPRTEALAQVLTFVGAGIYEEAIFRLGLYSVLYWVLKKISLFPLLPFLLAAAVSAVLFAAAHHMGPHGEKFDGYVFLFRAVAGVYFAFVYQLRGFGIAVGAHAGYDVLVGALV
jgi:membrane protease YdiL (CAAX protease family)